MEKMEVMQFMKEIQIKESRATTRMGHLPIEGGGLNAGYDTVDAISNMVTNVDEAPFRLDALYIPHMLNTWDKFSSTITEDYMWKSLTQIYKIFLIASPKEQQANQTILSHELQQNYYQILLIYLDLWDLKKQ